MKNRWPLIASFVLFIVLCASLAYWALQLFQPPPRPVAAPPRAATPEINPQSAAALFGGRAGVAAASNYQLRGVIFANNARDSVAILSADGKPAQAIRAGTEVVPGVTVKEVHRGYVLLAEGGAVKRVDLPESAAEQGSGAISAPVAARPVTPPPPPPPPPIQQALPQSPAPVPGVVADPNVASDPNAVPDAASARARAFGQQQPPEEGGTSGAPAEFAPSAPSSVVVNPGGGVSTEVNPAPGN